MEDPESGDCEHETWNRCDKHIVAVAYTARVWEQHNRGGCGNPNGNMVAKSPGAHTEGHKQTNSMIWMVRAKRDGQRGTREVAGHHVVRCHHPPSKMARTLRWARVRGVPRARSPPSRGFERLIFGRYTNKHMDYISSKVEAGRQRGRRAVVVTKVSVLKLAY